MAPHCSRPVDLIRRGPPAKTDRRVFRLAAMTRFANLPRETATIGAGSCWCRARRLVSLMINNDQLRLETRAGGRNCLRGSSRNQRDMRSGDLMQQGQDFRRIVFRMAEASQPHKRRWWKVRETLDTMILGTLSTSVGVVIVIVGFQGWHGVAVASQLGDRLDRRRRARTGRTRDLQDERRRDLSALGCRHAYLPDSNVSVFWSIYFHAHFLVGPQSPGPLAAHRYGARAACQPPIRVGRKVRWRRA